MGVKGLGRRSKVQGLGFRLEDLGFTPVWSTPKKKGIDSLGIELL